MIKKIFAVSLIAAGVFALAACSSSHKAPEEDNYGMAPVADNGATASGYGAGTGFGGGDGAGGPPYDGHPMQVGNQSYYFDFDRSDVRNSDMASIKVQANYLVTHPRAKVLLEGNTDERGSREYNIALGERRANSILAVLQADGVNRSQITTVSYGAEKPIAYGHDEDSYTKNRRVDLVYQTPISR